MKKLKISIETPTKNADFLQYLPNRSRNYNGWTIFFNDEISEADAWFVIESTKGESCKIPTGSLFFGSAETSWPSGYYSDHSYRSEFLNQFDFILSCHEIFLPNHTGAIPFLPWMINANHGESMHKSHARDFDYLKNMLPPKKSKILSVICSNQNEIPGQKLRLNFLRYLKENSDIQFDWYGNGIKRINQKWEGLIDYKYTLVLENQIKNNLITEKLYDAYLTYAFPIYWGAPNVAEYFPKDSYFQLDLTNPNQMIRDIKKMLNTNHYNQNEPALFEARNLVLEKYNFLHRIVEIVSDRLGGVNNSEKKVVQLKSINEFKSKELIHLEKKAQKFSLIRDLLRFIYSKL